MLRDMTTGEFGTPAVHASVRIAGVQCAFRGTRDQTLERVLLFTKQALEKGAMLLVYPECFALPWFHASDHSAYRDLAEPVPGPSTDVFLELSRHTPATFICPVFEIKDGHYFFSSVVIRSGDILGVYRKVHLASAVHWREVELADPGVDLPVFDIGLAKIAIAMGWDVFFPEAICSMALKGAQILVAPTAAAMASKFRWLSVLTSHAVCNNIFVVRVNRCGEEHALSFYGESFCIDPYGVLIDEPTFHKDSLLLADLDLGDLSEARREFPFLADRKPALYSHENPCDEEVMR